MAFNGQTRLLELRAQVEQAYETGNWRNLPIEDNGEPLVLVPPHLCYPWYALEMRLTNDTRTFLRRTVYGLFLIARLSLNAMGFDLKVYDGWRSVELQENLFWYYLKRFTASRFNLQEQFQNCYSGAQIKRQFLSLPEAKQEELKKANTLYVSWPSTDPKSPSPHATGGSIDVWLYRNDKPANLGVPFDWMDEEAGAFYHLREERKSFGAEDMLVCYNREILLTAMVAAGFSCYPYEFWHFNYGNQMDSLVTGRQAFYS